MPLPFILGGVALAAAGFGVKKGFDAKEDYERAERIGNRAKRKLNIAQKSFDDKRNYLNTRFEDFAKFKINIFNKEIKYLVDITKICKKTKSKLAVEHIFTEEEIKEMSHNVEIAANLLGAGISSISAGALTAFGAYGLAGVFATASTGTAIASLSGVAATNATLAFFGGGSLAAGGLGMAGGMAVLGGLVAGPALAVMGFMAASSAEEAVTDARRFEAKVEKAIEKMKVAELVMDKIDNYIDELINVITNIQTKFNENIVNNCHDSKFKTMLILGRALKDSLEISVLDKNGDLKENPNFRKQIESLEV